MCRYLCLPILTKVARSVIQRQPDLYLGVQEKSTDICQAFFGDFNDWVKEIKDRATNMVVSTQKTARDVQEVLTVSENIKAIRTVASQAFSNAGVPQPLLGDRPRVLQLEDASTSFGSSGVSSGGEDGDVVDVTSSFDHTGRQTSDLQTADPAPGSSGGSSSTMPAQDGEGTSNTDGALGASVSLNASQVLKDSLVSLGESLGGELFLGFVSLCVPHILCGCQSFCVHNWLCVPSFEDSNQHE